MRSIKDIIDLQGKKVLLRTDFDVPVSATGVVEESFRISRQKEMIDELLEKGARVVMLSHITSIDSFEPILSQLEKILERKIKLTRDSGFRISDFEFADIVLLENVRQWDGEKKNDREFASGLAKGFDLYINNAFAVCHRDYASVSAITELLPSFAGYILEEEILNLKKAVEFPSDGKVIIMGGAKASTKVPVIKNFLNKASKILIGGVIANDILKKQGVEINDSKFDDNFSELLEGLDLDDPRIVMPNDYHIHEGKYLDIGPESVKNYTGIISGAKLIIWNGPMGYFEDDRFGGATKAIGEAVADSSAFKVIGGGDTVAAINKFKLDPKKFNLISTGGGAMLSFLSGEILPGLRALGYYES